MDDTQSNALVVLALLVAAASAPIGGWVASTKGRSVAEGVVLGLLLGLLGPIIEALLPAVGPGPSGPRDASIAAAIRAGHVAWVAEQFREGLDRRHPGWESLPPKRLKALLAGPGERCRLHLGLGRSEFKDLSAEARAMLAREAEGAKEARRHPASRAIRTGRGM